MTHQAPRCPLFGSCGGCQLQDLTYQAQLDWKTAELRRLYKRWAFFRAIVENLEMTLAKSSLVISSDYLSLVDDDRLYRPIVEEHERTVGAVLEIAGEKRLLDRHPVLRRSIELRNPYVDPMNQVQVELLRRWRAGGGEEVRRPLQRSIAGIAAALRNTG